MSSSNPGWSFIPDPPPSMKAMAVEMQQLSVALAEAGFTATQIETLLNYQILVVLMGMRRLAEGRT